MIREGRQVIQVMAGIPRALPLFVLRAALFMPVFTTGLARFQSGEPSALLGAAQMVLAVVILIGLGTRFAAMALLVVIALLAILLPAQWPNQHLPWAAMALTLVVYGGGGWSLEGLIPSLGGSSARDRRRPRDETDFD